MTAPTSPAVMASRREPPSSLDYFPTPPWATRALLEHVIGWDHAGETCWEPACGEGHMLEVLNEAFYLCLGSDVHDYGYRNSRIGSFVGVGPDVIQNRVFASHWIITNPPFNLAVEFAERALGEATDGVALLVRMQWLEGVDRYKRLFSVHPPAIVAPFVERVPMVKGRWDPGASTATAYAWIVWRIGEAGPTRLEWIPPGCRERLTRPEDLRRWVG